jgi:hypothetical protein
MSENKPKLELKPKDGLWFGTIDGKEFGFKKLTWGEKNQVMAISQKMMPNGQLTFDLSTFNVNLLLATVKKAPFNLSKEGFENYPDAKLIDKLLSIATQMNIAEQVEVQNL